MQVQLQPLFDQTKSRQWATSPDRDIWIRLATNTAPASETGDASGVGTVQVGLRRQVTTFLGNLMCETSGNGGAVARGIVNQALTVPKFRGDKLDIFNRLKGNGCPGAAKLPADLINDLGAAVAGSPRQ